MTVYYYAIILVQDHIPEVITSQNCHMNVGQILSGHGATDI
jgi:hypothetical protein